MEYLVCNLKEKKDNPSRERVMRILRRNLENIRKFGVSKIGLFGSISRGEQRKGSDIDILIHFNSGEETMENLMGLHQLLVRLLGDRIDLVTSGGLSPYIGPHILKEVQYIEEIH
jgi:predicted nucleotidyltransferase